MAVTSIWPINGPPRKVIDYARNPEKTTEQGLDELAALHTINGVVEYAADEMKTETRSYVTCLNCTSEETAAEDFMEVKRLWDKLGGRQCFHGYQSFRAGEEDAETAHAIGVERATRLWGDRFQVVIATHCNTGHYHTHFVLNSVSWLDGYHFDNRPEDYQAMRDLSDELCRKYRLSVIENPSGHGKHYAEYRAEQEGRPTNRGLIRADMDRAIAASVTREEFFTGLEEMGYTLKLFKKNGDWLEYPSLKPPGAKGFFRFHKLGQGYDLDEIDRRILKNLRRAEPFPEAEQEKVADYRQRDPPPQYHRQKPKLYRLYLRYCYELHIIEKHPASVQRVSFFMREDLARLDRLDAQTRLLAEAKISTTEDLLGHREELLRSMESLTEKRADLRNEVRRLQRQHDPIAAEAMKGQVAEITKKLRDHRKGVRLCDEILLRSAQTREELEYLLNQQERKQGKEADSNELFRGRGGTGRAYEPGGR